MSKLLSDVEKDPLYQWALERLCNEEQAIVAEETAKIIGKFDDALIQFEKLLKRPGGHDRFLEAVKNSLNKGDFKDNDGVSPLLWPEKH